MPAERPNVCFEGVNRKSASASSTSVFDPKRTFFRCWAAYRVADAGCALKVGVVLAIAVLGNIGFLLGQRKQPQRQEGKDRDRDRDVIAAKSD